MKWPSGVGLGKPERLGHDLTEFWSRRFSQKDLLVYRFDDQRIYIFTIGSRATSKGCAW